MIIFNTATNEYCVTKVPDTPGEYFLFNNREDYLKQSQRELFKNKSNYFAFYNPNSNSLAEGATTNTNYNE